MSEGEGTASNPAAGPEAGGWRLEEPGLPDLDRVWPQLRRQWRLLLAVVVAVAVHALVLLSGHGASGGPSRPTRAESLAVHLEASSRPASAPVRAVVARMGADNPVLPAPAPTPSKPQRRSKAVVRPEPEDGTRLNVQTLPAPPALIQWWSYADSSLGYFPATELDVQSAPADFDRFEESFQQAPADLAGLVQVRIFINESGGVDRVLIEHAEPPGVLDAFVMQQLYQLRFTPALKDGLYVKSRKDVLLEVRPDPAARARQRPGLPAHLQFRELDPGASAP